MESQFSRLAPFIREYVYEKKWRTLRDIQEAAIAEVLDGDGHLLIASGTASGKTEACFFPIISMLCEIKPASVGALYIGPLKALINDQAQRLEPLTELAEIPLWKWHGDVSGRHKKNLLENPSGILQITPESLEALLLRNPGMIRSLFQNLCFVIIDEVHAFMGSERGGQILCQLARIEEAALCRPRRVGLSASLGDYRGAMEGLGRGSGRGGNTALVRGEKNRRLASIALDHFESAGKGAEGIYFGALYREVRGRRCIIFTNSRSDAEETIAALAEIAVKHRGNDRFFVHHGSVPASLRGETERELRDSPGPVTEAATASLEMGIDIGKLDRVIQIGPPLSVSAFVQRLGRSGRLRGRPEIYFTSLETREKPEHPVNGLPLDLIKTIAVIELYLKEKWIEQGEENPLPYSLLVHQTLSILCSLGPHSPSSLEKRVLSLPAFSAFSGADFRELLSHLESLDLVEKTGEGEIIAGLEAGRLAGHYSFYPVFAGGAEYRVIAGGREIGVVNFVPPAGGGIVLGGRCWKVETIRLREREIIVSPGEAGGSRAWQGSGAEINPKIVSVMRKVLAETEVYPYLSGRAKIRLAEARALAKEWRLGEEIFIMADNGPEEPDAAGPRLFVILPWLGSRAMRALLLILQNRDYRCLLGIRSLSRENEYSVNIRSALPLPRFRSELAEIIKRHQSAESLYPLIDPAEIPLTGKFDPWLPSLALVRQYAAALLEPLQDTQIIS